MNLLNYYSKIRLSPDGCMLWQGSLDKDGYGRYGKVVQMAHRLSYLINIGDLVPGLTIDHLCRVRSCVNPRHLEQVTIKENLARSVTYNSTKTHCPKGHDFNELNTYLSPKGERHCRPCNKIASYTYKKRKVGN